MPGKRTLEGARKIALAVELRAHGKSYQEIADHLGYANKRTAYNLVQEGLREIIKEPAEELRALECRRLDEALAEMMDQVRNGTDTGKREAVDRLIKIMDRRAKYLGLDMPVRMHVGLDLPENPTEALLKDEQGALLAAQIEAYVAGAAASQGNVVALPTAGDHDAAD